MKISAFGLVVLVLLWMTPAAQAGNSYLVVATAPQQVSVAAQLDLDATYVVVPLNVQCDDRDPLRRAARVAGATQQVIEQARAKGDIQLRQGRVSFSAGESSSFKSSYSSQSSGSTLYVVSHLQQSEDIYTSARVIAFANSLQRSDCISIHPGSVALGLENPERYRAELLTLIADQAAAAKTGLGGAKEIVIGGLEKAVAVVQKDARQVSLFIPYSISLQL